MIERYVAASPSLQLKRAYTGSGVANTLLKGTVDV